MLFYRVKPKFDGVLVRKCGLALIGNELLTPEEYAELLMPDSYGKRLDPYFVELVRIRKKNTYTHWGARFEKEVVK